MTDTAGDADPSSSGRLASQAIGQLLLLGGVLCLSLALLFLIQGRRSEAIYSGEAGLAFIIGGLARVLGGRATHHGRCPPDGDSGPRRRSTRRFVTGCAIGVVVLVVAVRLWHEYRTTIDDDRGVAGIAEPGDYRNAYFGFQIRYGQDWQDTTADARAQAASAFENADRMPALLALARTSAALGDDAAGVMFAAEPLGSLGADATGAAYLRRMLGQLEKRPDPPRDVHEEPQTVIGGLTFDRLSLSRPWGDGAIPMTYWATVKRGYVLIIWGTYSTSEGLSAIDRLLSQVVEYEE